MMDDAAALAASLGLRSRTDINLYGHKAHVDVYWRIKSLMDMKLQSQRKEYVM